MIPPACLARAPGPAWQSACCCYRLAGRPPHTPAHPALPRYPLQVLLSQVHRLRALVLLGRFLDMGAWAVDLALSGKGAEQSTARLGRPSDVADADGDVQGDCRRATGIVGRYCSYFGAL